MTALCVAFWATFLLVLACGPRFKAMFTLRGRLRDRISCHFMSSIVIGLFRPAFNKVGREGTGGGGDVKYGFLSHALQLCYFNSYLNSRIYQKNRRA
jgi:hypothetical protein